MKTHSQKKKIITRRVLWGLIILFGIFWKPESETTRIGQYIIIGNLILLSLLMEVLPIIFAYKYRRISLFLKYFMTLYKDTTHYSYTPIVVIRSQIYDTNREVYITKLQIKSGFSLFDIYYKGQLYDFRTNLIQKDHIIDLASVIIYCLNHDIPYELLHEHSKHIASAL
jgi:hypothetical protein